MVDESHWNTAYATKGEAGVSWYQPEPTRSLELIRAWAPDAAASVVDVGGGASRLVDDLSRRGYADLTVLDISKAALDAVRLRLGGAAARVTWIAADVTQWQPARSWNVWHDRAVFHFLTSTEGQEAYLRALRTGTTVGSVVIIATFAPDGPERCSGLPVQRYDARSLAARLGDPFELVASSPEAHRTPGGSTQSFLYCVFRRRSSLP